MALLWGVAGLGLGPGLAMPVLADVKEGVEAWSRGDFAAAVRLWRIEADKGDADAQFNLAQAYRLGRGVNADFERAENYYAKAAAQGHLQAADNYGLLLFQDGRREEALPYVEAAAGRGDPRAQYLLGIAHFNGDLVSRDWVRAYALMSLAHGAGLPQAAPALAEMDRHIPHNQRQMGAGLAPQIQQEADARRAQEMAAADFAMGQEGPPRHIAHVAATVPASPTQSAIQQAQTVSGAESPAMAGADYARPAPQQAAQPATQPATQPAARPQPAGQPARQQSVAAAPAAAPVAATGPWRVQLGAFSVPGNAERLWSQIGGKGVLAGKSRVMEPSGNLTRLFAGGFASQADAQAACTALKRGGQNCLVTR